MCKNESYLFSICFIHTVRVFIRNIYFFSLENILPFSSWKQNYINNQISSEATTFQVSTKAINCISSQKCIADLRNQILIKTFFLLSIKSHNAWTLGPESTNTKDNDHLGFSKVANTVEILQPQKDLSEESKGGKHSQGGEGGTWQKSECFNWSSDRCYMMSAMLRC